MLKNFDLKSKELQSYAKKPKFQYFEFYKLVHSNKSIDKNATQQWDIQVKIIKEGNLF